MRTPPWRLSGREPDYRFSLANERTFLAWIRTALSLLAGGVLLEQFATRLEPRIVVVGLAIALAILLPSCPRSPTFAGRRTRSRCVMTVRCRPRSLFLCWRSRRRLCRDHCRRRMAEISQRDPGLQPQRTALAWVRTGLAVFVNALIVLRTGIVSKQFFDSCARNGSARCLRAVGSLRNVAGPPSGRARRARGAAMDLDSGDDVDRVDCQRRGNRVDPGHGGVVRSSSLKIPPWGPSFLFPDTRSRAGHVCSWWLSLAWP